MQILERVILHKYLHPIYFKHTNISELSDFVRVQQFHTANTFIEVVVEGNAAVPALNFTAAGPEFYVYGIGRLQHTFESGDVN